MTEVSGKKNAQRDGTTLLSSGQSRDKTGGILYVFITSFIL